MLHRFGQPTIDLPCRLIIQPQTHHPQSGAAAPHSKSFASPTRTGWRASVLESEPNLWNPASSAFARLWSFLQLQFSAYFNSMPPPRTPWPHAPTHQLSQRGTYFVTVGTYLKAHHFRGAERLRVLHRGLLTVAQDFNWRLEAWAVFSNHYHFVGHSPEKADDATSLSQMLGVLHTKTAAWVNRLDRLPGRKVWQNFWDTRLTYEKSYLARLNYVHQNPARHRLVAVSNQYPWCSAAWFERTASPAMVKSIYRFKVDRVRLLDEFEPSSDW